MNNTIINKSITIKNKLNLVDIFHNDSDAIKFDCWVFVPIENETGGYGKSYDSYFRDGTTDDFVLEESNLTKAAMMKIIIEVSDDIAHDFSRDERVSLNDRSEERRVGKEC